MGSKKAYIYILEKLLYLTFWLLLGVQTQTLVHCCSLIWVFWKTPEKNDGINFSKVKDFSLNALSVKPTKWSNTLKQFVGSLSTNCLSVLDHFVRLALKLLKGLIHSFPSKETFILMKISGQLHLLANNWIKVLQYATFKVRKFASLFYKINTCLQRNSTCIGLQADQMLCKYTILIFFQFWVWVLRFLFHVISTSSGFLLLKKTEIIFASLCFYLYELKK